jgi:hypothetical protein
LFNIIYNKKVANIHTLKIEREAVWNVGEWGRWPILSSLVNSHIWNKPIRTDKKTLIIVWSIYGQKCTPSSPYCFINVFHWQLNWAFPMVPKCVLLSIWIFKCSFFRFFLN